MAVAILLMIVATTIWLYYDASQRDWSQSGFAKAPWQWVVGSLLLWIVVFPLYLLQRGKATPKA